MPARIFAQLTIVAAICTIGVSRPLHAQMPESRQVVLKGLTRVATVYRLNANAQTLPPREWDDIVRIALHRALPEMKVDSTAAPGVAWLELDVISDERGGSIALSLMRWVTINDTKTTAFAPVWSTSRALVGGFSRQLAQDAIESLINEFAADVIRGR